MKNKFGLIITVLILILIGGVAYWHYGQRNLNQLSGQLGNSNNIVGGDRDAHGCIGSAGYSWCAAKQQCLRPWEEACAATSSANLVTYYCQEGILKAEYASSSIKLTLKDNSTTTLPQVMSGSGIRYEKGTMVFVSKGDNAFLTQKNKTTYTDCIAGKVTASQGKNTYTDNSNTFSFSYPGNFILSGGEIGYSQDWSNNSSSTGLLLAVVTIPRTFLPGTNFGEAKFTVGTSADPDAVKHCLVSNFGNMATSTSLIIGDRRFTKISYTDAGAGNYYEVSSYRTVYNGQCYAVESLIHSSNIANYSPDQGVKPFDRLKVSFPLEDMVRSFKLLASSSPAVSQ